MMCSSQQIYQHNEAKLLENIGIFETLKGIFDLLVLPMVGIVTYVFSDLRGIKKEMNSFKLEVAKDYITKTAVKDIESSIISRMDEHKAETRRHYENMTGKLDKISDQLFEIAKGDK